MQISALTPGMGAAAKSRDGVVRRGRYVLQMVAALAIVPFLFACTSSEGRKTLPTPPGLVVGAGLADIRMFEFDQRSRVTHVDGTVVAIAWPWVLVGSRGDPQNARYWVNFAHVCSFRLET